MDTNKLHWLLEALGNIEEPIGIYYANEPPDGGYTSSEKPGHDCILKQIRLARIKKSVAWFDGRAQPRCMGGWTYMGYALPPSDNICLHVTTGLPNREGERYLPQPASLRRMFNEVDIRPAPGRYCIAKPLSLFEEAKGEEPLFVIFFARGEVLSGLCQLAWYALDDHRAVEFPFGSGCANILAWPFHYFYRNRLKAVVGGADPSSRPFMNVDEMTVTFSLQAFEMLLNKAPESFLSTHTWQTVLKKIAKSKSVWNE